MSNSKEKMIFRWLVLVAVVINVAFSYLYNYLPLSTQSIGEVSSKYNSLFTPAPYAFGIWGLIYLSFLVYAVFQLLPQNRDKILYNRLAGPMIFANMLGIAWIISYTTNMIGLSVVIMLVTLMNAITMFTLVRGRIRDCEYTPWLTVPFSLYAGWITVATIANVSQWLVALGWNNSPQAQTGWVMALIALSAALGIMVGYRHRDWIYTAVVAWALIAIGVADKTTYFLVGVSAFIAGSVVGTWSLGYAVHRIHLYSKDPMYMN